MSVDFVVGMMSETVKVTLLVSAPVLIVGLVYEWRKGALDWQ